MEEKETISLFCLYCHFLSPPSCVTIRLPYSHPTNQHKTELEHANRGGGDNDNKQNQVLRQALSLQLELQQTRAEMQNLQKALSKPPASTPSDKVNDHSFDHFVDYRSLAEFESH